MSVLKQSQKLHWFAILTAVATLGLIGLGGMVTSKGAGMTVPDWPNSYGYSMYFFPITQWVGGIFYEHTHRLYASTLGQLTSILAIWLWGRGTRGKVRWAGWLTIFILLCMLAAGMILRGSGNASGGASTIPMVLKVLAVVLPILLAFGIVKSIKSKGALHWLGMTAYFAVILQGLLGGFRVALYMDQIGIFHAVLAQLFLVLLGVIALMSSAWWVRAATPQAAPNKRFVQAGLVICGLVLLQLILGATMRHQHAGLAVPDFPLAYGKVWPDIDAAVAKANPERVDPRDFKPITANQILLHMAHRIGALLIWLATVSLAVAYVGKTGWQSGFTKAAVVWAGMVSMQAFLGAWTVWSNKAADIATLHVVLGAATFVFGGLMTVCGFRCRILWQNRKQPKMSVRRQPEQMVSTGMVMARGN